jgi:hypothetical protein
MRAFGFDEWRSGTRCSQEQVLTTGTYNTGLKAGER